jgi:wyosine [tRNA(Phe)-imidazoG37] synthetase (radical SAM superfamily)
MQTHSTGTFIPGKLAQTFRLRTAFGCPRDDLGNRYVYAVISPRARGLSIGVNLNPDKYCNFDCIYCEIDRSKPSKYGALDLEILAGELEQTLASVQSEQIARRPFYSSLPLELLQLRHVTLSGAGEPTLCPQFLEVVQTVTHLRAVGKRPFFKIVLITNASGLDLPEVREGLNCFIQSDEIWAKLEAGTQAYMDQVNRSSLPLQKILDNTLLTARLRPVIIQSLFPMINGQETAPEEIEAFAQRLRELKEAGAQIPLVQIYSATRPTAHPECGHLPLKSLSRIARRVREVSGLEAEVF